MTNANDSVDSIVRPFEGEVKEKCLSKREYFAAMIMQGLLAAHSEQSAIGTWQTEVKEKTEHAVLLADALINALNKTK